MILNYRGKKTDPNGVIAIIFIHLFNNDKFLIHPAAFNISARFKMVPAFKILMYPLSEKTAVGLPENRRNSFVDVQSQKDCKRNKTQKENCFY